MKDSVDLVIIDDDSMTLSSTARLMRSQGYTVRESGTAGGGYTLIREKKPDLILSDVDLPDFSGIELCRRIKSDAAFDGTYVILISHSSIASDAQAHAMEMGADGYIARPIPNRELLARVKAFLRIQAAESIVRTKVKQQNEIIAIGHMGLQGCPVETMIEETRRCIARGIGINENMVRFIPAPPVSQEAGVSEHNVPLCLSSRIEGAAGSIGSFEVAACLDGLYSQEDENFLRSATTILSLAVIRRQNEETIAFMARHDSLTGLWNRRQFDEWIELASRPPTDPAGEVSLTATPRDLGTAGVASAASGFSGLLAFPLGVIVADVDRLKVANDVYGHSIGDTLLRSMAGHLASAFPPPALVARIGGDEFAVLVPYAQEDRILEALEKLHVSVTDSGKAGGTGLPEDFEPAISVGWVLAHSFDMMNSALIKADEAMYSEKRQKNPGR